jgi:F-type H+-transporting ATPase subunit epsilon
VAKTHVEVIAAERVVFSDAADIVVAPGAEGQLGILPRHAPLLTLLAPGDVVIRNDGEETVIAVGGRLHGGRAGPRSRPR